jgi:hypothetical protein
MFVNTCTACDKRQLIFPSQFKAVESTPAGTLIHYTCWCGAEQSWPGGLDGTRREPVAVAA